MNPTEDESDATDPRTKPVQARARATIQRVQRAAVDVLNEVGYGRLTTERVAEKAGVSVGTLYRYFPNKEALVDSLTRDHFERLNALITEHTASIFEGGDLVAGLTRIVAAVMGAQIETLETNLAVINEVPLARRLPIVKPFMELQQQVTASLISQFSDHVRDIDPALAAFMLHLTTSSMVERLTALAPERLNDPDVHREVAEMVLRYLGVEI